MQVQRHATRFIAFDVQWSMTAVRADQFRLLAKILRAAEGRFVDDKGAPVLNLDDLVVTLRNAITSRGQFGCSIDPRKDNLAAAKAVQEKWSKQPLKPGQRDRWLNEICAPASSPNIYARSFPTAN